MAFVGAVPLVMVVKTVVSSIGLVKVGVSAVLTVEMSALLASMVVMEMSVMVLAAMMASIVM